MSSPNREKFPVHCRHHQRVQYAGRGARCGAGGQQRVAQPTGTPRRGWRRDQHGSPVAAGAPVHPRAFGSKGWPTHETLCRAAVRDRCGATILIVTCARLQCQRVDTSQRLGTFRCHEKFSLAKRRHLAIMCRQLGKERTVTLQGVFVNPCGTLYDRLRFLVRCH